MAGTVAPMSAPVLSAPIRDRVRPYAISAFAAVTLLIWGNRVWLAWTDPKLDLAGKLGYSIPITAFVVAALATLVMQLTSRARTPAFRRVLAVFCAGTIFYWLIRLPIILFRHHSIPFKLIHTTLALVLVVMALGALATARRQRRRLSARHNSRVRPFERPSAPAADVTRSARRRETG